MPTRDRHLREHNGTCDEPLKKPYVLLGRMYSNVNNTYFYWVGRTYKRRKAAASVTRLGDFCKFLATNCLAKVAQIFW